jgi:hypothetical protein
LPPRYVVPTEPLPLAAGRVIFIRRAGPQGLVEVLDQSYRMGQRHHGLYVRLVLDTRRGHLTAHLDGRVVNAASGTGRCRLPHPFGSTKRWQISASFRSMMR